MGVENGRVVKAHPAPPPPPPPKPAMPSHSSVHASPHDVIVHGRPVDTMQFQQKQGLEDTGKVDQHTLAAAANPNHLTHWVRGERELELGSHGTAVDRVQRRLHIKVDGNFGARTRQAVINFQRRRGLEDDGIAGLHTWAALFPLHPTAGKYKPGVTPTSHPAGSPAQHFGPGVYDKMPGMSEAEKNFLHGQNWQLHWDVYSNDGYNGFFSAFTGDSYAKNPQGNLNIADRNGQNGDVTSHLVQYLNGKGSVGQHEPLAQRLHNLLSVLGPDNSYAFLSVLRPGYADSGVWVGTKTFDHIKTAFNTLVEQGKFTQHDAQKLVQAQLDFSKSNPGAHFQNTTVNDLMMGLKTKNGNASAVQIAYARASFSHADTIDKQISLGNFPSGTKDQLIRDRNEFYEQASLVGALAKGYNQQKLGLFRGLVSSMNSLAHTRGHSDNYVNEKHVMAAWAANILGSLDDKSQIPQELSKQFGANAIGPDGTFDTSSNPKLRAFLNDALAGQALLGVTGRAISTPQSTSPYQPGLDGVSTLFKGIAESGDGHTKLMAATVDLTAQYMINHPHDASVLVAQDTAKGGDGFRNALTSMLDKGFNDFLHLGTAHHVYQLQDQTVKDLKLLTAVAVGPPFSLRAAGYFVKTIGKHVTPLAEYAQGGRMPDNVKNNLTRLFGDVPGDRRLDAAYIFGQIMGAFSGGYDQEQAQLMKIAGSAKGHAYNNTLADAFLSSVGVAAAAVSIATAQPEIELAAKGVAAAAGLVLTGTKFAKYFQPGSETDAQAVQNETNTILKYEGKYGNTRAIKWAEVFYSKVSEKLSDLGGPLAGPIARSNGEGKTDGYGLAFSEDLTDFNKSYDPDTVYKNQTGHDALPG